MRYILAATYLLAMALVSYFVSDTARAGEGFWDSWTFFVLYVAAHAAVGFAIGRWWALLLIPAAAWSQFRPATPRRVRCLPRLRS
jgi:hypothetical protein